MKITFHKGSETHERNVKKRVGGADCAKTKRFSLILKVSKIRKHHHGEVKINFKNEGRMTR